ncbi:type IV secretory system conjugative DNA transfer family protein [Dawidia soli]|uniref:TraM recognition domain-containing protein n=1 Tax=Dawidia soli TaxID=2782352 RepID=A0AAP2DEX2_9BACT|nr:TraM recognition domain-containing protein [Dawidia soli]MBT1689876.1 TraM recognition domain-containing protein [Dawidia soli]
MNIHPFSLEQPLLGFQSEPGETEYWTIANAVENVLILGATGSGKSSGSFETLVCKYLSAGFGGLILSAKSERKMWERYCSLTGRSHHLVVIEPFGDHAFDFINYESLHKPAGLSITDNILHVIRTVINASNEKDAGSSRDPFWDDARDTLIGNLLQLCQIAYGSITIQHLYDIVQSIPKDIGSRDEESPFSKALSIAKNKINQQIDEWEERIGPSVVQEYIDGNRFEVEAEKAIRDMRPLKMVDEFFTRQFIPLADKTRSTVEFTCITFLGRLMQEPIYSLFCGGRITVTPEDCTKGKILLVDLPIKTFDKAGRDAQTLVKFCFQRAFERRPVYNDTPPLFIFADESHNFITEYDPLFLSTSRSAKISSVYVTQNLASYYANMGGIKATAKVNSFLSNFNTKFFHANSDAETNRYASELIGEAYDEKPTHSFSVGRDSSQSRSTTPELKRVFRPEGFMRLMNGGADNNFVIEAILHRLGKPFTSGRNAIKVLFRQTPNEASVQGFPEQNKSSCSSPKPTENKH